MRTRKTADVSSYIEHAIVVFLERTEQDDLWSDEYLDELRKAELDGQSAKYGDPKKGFQWQTIFLPNGTNLKITYKGRDFFADVRREKIVADGVEHTPSEWARRVANNTNRNAWRDIWIQFKGSSQWQLADALRWKEKEAKR
ncbi:MAG: hypothetical protein GY796_22015 [Chloroflexi bacterium]|nr:hypothetical protein [Chloroflexota bacterium]